MSGDNADVFTIAVSREPPSLRVCLTGDANMNGVDRFGVVLGEVHADAVRLHCTEVVVDLKQLEFMNSACFKRLVTWITQVEKVDVDSRYRIRFLSNPKMHWQRRSLHALQCFALELVTVET